MEKKIGTGTSRLLAAILLLDQRPLTRVVSVALILLLTLTTQIGGILLWLALIFRGLVCGKSKAPGILAASGFVGLYALSTVWLVPLLAPEFGRVALACGSQPSGYAPASRLYCLTNRNYVREETREALHSIVSRMRGKGPVVYLDAGFPFFDGFPLLPHLSHRDGRQLDLALIYRDEESGERFSPVWPLGYWAFAPVAAKDRACPRESGPLRWSMEWVQPLFRRATLDRDATRHLLESALSVPQVGRVLLAPDLKRDLGLSDQRLRFAGCHAARHDDHIHLDIR